jgi:hypothetical protein
MRRDDAMRWHYCYSLVLLSLFHYHHIMSEATMTPPSPLKVNPSRKEVWSNNFEKVKEFYEKTGHLSLPNDREYSHLSQWLTYQRHRSKSLTKDQLELLESINYKNVPLHRDRDDDSWEAKYKQLKKLFDETGSIAIKAGQNAALSSWLTRQRTLLRGDQMDSTRRKLLEDLGITSSNCRTRRETGNQAAQWILQYEKLVEYQRVNGNCNVPRHYAADSSLGIWVSNQRRKYSQMKKGKGNMDAYRVEKLEELGFEWTPYDSKRKI